MSARATFTATGATWATFGLHTQMSIGGVASPSDASGVSSGIGPYWWDPTALAAMRPGQVLDTDPVTTMTVSVTGVGQGPAGPSVTITSSIPGTTGQASYDVATGVLVDQAIDVASSGTSIQLGLQQLP